MRPYWFVYKWDDGSGTEIDLYVHPLLVKQLGFKRLAASVREALRSDMGRELWRCPPAEGTMNRLYYVVRNLSSGAGYHVVLSGGLVFGVLFVDSRERFEGERGRVFRGGGGQTN